MTYGKAGPGCRYIRAAMTKQGLTNESLAARAGISTETLGRTLGNEERLSRTRLSTLCAICSVLDLPVGELAELLGKAFAEEPVAMEKPLPGSPLYDRVFHAMRRQGFMTQAELADAAGINPETLCRIMSGDPNYKMHEKTALKLAAALRTTFEYLTEGR